MQISSNKSSSCCAPALSFLLSLSLQAAPAFLVQNPSGTGARALQEHPVPVSGCPGPQLLGMLSYRARKRLDSGGSTSPYRPPCSASSTCSCSQPCPRSKPRPRPQTSCWHAASLPVASPLSCRPAWGAGTAVASACPALRCDVVGSRTSSLREVSGAIVFSGLVQLVLGVSGACGWTARRCGPMVLAPSLSIVGLSAYKEAAFFCSANWGVALLLVLLTVTFSQHLGSCRLPCCVWPFAQGGSAEMSVPTLRTFSVLLPFTSVCIICAVLSHLRVPWDSLELATEQLPWANSTVRSPWLRIPYPGEGGWPLLTPRALAVGIVMAIGGSVNSVGCYVLCGRLLRAPCLPPDACNRGLCTEALGSLLAGLLGAAGGTASSIANACASSLTQAGSRLSVQVSALVCVVLGMSPRLAGLLTRIPLVVHGGVLCVTYAVAVGTGISYFRYADIDSGRNIFIVGFTMFMALLVPRWLSTAPVHLATGWVPLDLLFLSLLMVPVFLTGFLSFFLENTVSGTLEERGLLTNLAARRGDRCPRGERDDISRIYRLPAGLRRLLPPSRCKAFPCCFLCPGREWEEEEEGSRAAEEGTAATGEGMHLLLKASTVEMQSERRPSETETPVWHVAA
ncbi:solute carrier family 23 member 3 isoform X2 [Struthio camelus]|uniref:solute carrier family 23 member 3 isoform X2 n=1 Tax=Struthio camelus TaxID=8801 RepID=UPI003603D76F